MSTVVRGGGRRGRPPRRTGGEESPIEPAGTVSERPNRIRYVSVVAWRDESPHGGRLAPLIYTPTGHGTCSIISSQLEMEMEEMMAEPILTVPEIETQPPLTPPNRHRIEEEVHEWLLPTVEGGIANVTLPPQPPQSEANDTQDEVQIVGVSEGNSAHNREWWEVDAMDVEELVGSLLAASGRSKDSMLYLREIDVDSVTPIAVSSSSSDTQGSPLLPEVLPLGQHHGSQAIDLDLETVQHPQTVYNELEASPREEDLLVGLTNDHHSDQQRSIVVLLGIHVEPTRSSHVETVPFEFQGSFSTLFAYLTQLRSSIAPVMTHLESEPTNIYVGYGLSPISVRDHEWDSMDNLVELGALKDILESGLMLAELPAVAPERALNFLVQRSKPVTSALYVFYFFNPLQGFTTPIPIMSNPVVGTQQLIDVYMSRRFEDQKEEVRSLAATQPKPKYRTAYRHIRQYRVVMDICVALGIGWEYNQRIGTAVVEGGLEIRLQDVLRWLNLNEGHFRNQRTLFIKAKDALGTLDARAGILGGEEKAFHDILKYFLTKEALEENDSTIPIYVFKAARRFSHESFDTCCNKVASYTALGIENIIQ